MRRWSIVLWMLAVVLGYWMVRMKPRPSHVVILIVVPSSPDTTGHEQAVADALETRLGEEGLFESVLTDRKYLSETADQPLLQRLGFGPGKRMWCAIIETDDDNKPLRTIDRFKVSDDPTDAAMKAIARAREWADL